jgi:ribosomal protein S18 acetylase RimI-like enzyme
LSPKTMSHKVSTFFHEERGFRYAIANEKFGDAIIDLLSECFSHEPMGAALGLSAHDLAPLIARFISECTNNGLSVIATPADNSEMVAGAFICRDFKSPLPEGVPGDFPWFSPIAEALMKLDGDYEAKRPELVLGEALDLWMVGVSPCTQFARQGIASTLFRLSAEVGRKRNFKRCLTECTGHYSQTAARNSGFKERERLVYRDFRFQGRAVFAEIEAPHTDLILFEREF